MSDNTEKKDDYDDANDYLDSEIKFNNSLSDNAQ